VKLDIGSPTPFPGGVGEVLLFTIGVNNGGEASGGGMLGGVA
jgi:hypothetical protein